MGTTSSNKFKKTCVFPITLKWLMALNIINPMSLSWYCYGEKANERHESEQQQIWLVFLVVVHLTLLNVLSAFYKA